MRDDIAYVIKWFQDAGVRDVIIEPDDNGDNRPEEISDLQSLKVAMENVECALKATALNMVFGTGNEKSDIVFVGEAPGAEEDKQGLPFVGQSGQLLTKAINAIGFDRDDLYITNVVPWRPLGNRTPTNDEIELYRPYLLKHIRIISPKIVVCLGSTAARALLQENTGISKLRGRVIQGQKIFGRDIKIITTFHPAYLLRTPSQKREFWRDFLFVKSMLQACS